MTENNSNIGDPRGILKQGLAVNNIVVLTSSTHRPGDVEWLADWDILAAGWITDGQDARGGIVTYAPRAVPERVEDTRS